MYKRSLRRLSPLHSLKWRRLHEDQKHPRSGFLCETQHYVKGTAQREEYRRLIG